MKQYTIGLQVAVREMNSNVQIKGLVETPLVLAQLSPAAIAGVSLAIARQLLKSYHTARVRAGRKASANSFGARLRCRLTRLFSGRRVIDRMLAVQATVRETAETVKIQISSSTPDLGDLSPEAIAAVGAIIAQTLVDARFKTLALRQLRSGVNSAETEEGNSPSHRPDWINRMRNSGNLNN